MDGTGWTATGIAGVEAVTIAALVVGRRHRALGRRIRISVVYNGPDTEDTEVTRQADADQLELPGIAEPSRTPAVSSPPVESDR